MTEDHDVLNPDVIESLRALEVEGEPSLFEELVTLFLSDTPSRMRELEVALGSGDAQAVEEAAHSLKSSCGNLGAVQLATLFRQIEEYGRSQELESVASLVARSNQEFQRVEQALRSELD